MIWLVLCLVAVAIAVWAYDVLEGERLAVDVIDEWRLSRTPLAVFDRYWANNPNRSDVIVSLTAIPSRLPMIADTLKSLMRQTRAPAEIRLHLPRYSRREKTSYVIPEWLLGLSAVRIVECDDLGPATKFLPALRSLAADAKLMVVDDDRIYAPRVLEILEEAAARAPDAAYGLSGWIVPADLTDRPTTLLSNILERPPVPIRATRRRRARAVDILQGMSGYLVRPRFFDLERLGDYTSAPEEAFFVDDVWISAHCRVPKYVVPAWRAHFQAKRRAAFYRRTSLGLLNRGGGDTSKRSNTIMLKYFARSWRVGGLGSSADPHHLGGGMGAR